MEPSKRQAVKFSYGRAGILTTEVSVMTFAIDPFGFVGVCGNLLRTVKRKFLGQVGFLSSKAFSCLVLPTSLLIDYQVYSCHLRYNSLLSCDPGRPKT